MEKEQINVLLVEDNADDAILVREFLAQNDRVRFTIEWAQLLEEGIERLQAGRFDIVLLDLGLPDISGLDTLGNLYFFSADVPIVVLTGQADEELALAALQEGAQDYLYKTDMDGDSLGRTLRYVIERYRLQKEMDDIKGMVLQAEAVEATARNIEKPLKVIVELADKGLQDAGEDPAQCDFFASLRHHVQKIEEIVDAMGVLGQYDPDRSAGQ